ncbi:hypothetical protein K466DRAFT_506563, partial [Polyporus arcularius HHB13444]
MSSQRARFATYRRLQEPMRVWLGDDRYILAVGVGSMYLDLNDHRAPVLISRVFYVPELHGNLLSVSRLASGGLTVQFVEHGCRIVDDKADIIVGTASLKDGLYILN